MRIPEPLFPFLNRVMRLLLASPAHGVVSGSILVVHFTGRKSRRRRATPVRYLRESDDLLICLTGRETGWWPNFLEPAQVELRLAGRRVFATAHSLPDDEAAKEDALRRMLSRFPADAPYHGIAGGGITEADIAAAVRRDVLVTFRLGS